MSNAERTPVDVCDNDGYAVGGHDRQYTARSSRDGGVGAWGPASTQRRCIGIGDVNAMHLL